MEDILLVEEEQIEFWTTYCRNKLNINAEPSCAISIAAAYNWAKNYKEKSNKKNILILISGRNYQT